MKTKMYENEPKEVKQELNSVIEQILEILDSYTTDEKFIIIMEVSHLIKNRLYSEIQELKDNVERKSKDLEHFCTIKIEK